MWDLVQIGKSYGHKIIKTLKIDLTPNYGSTLLGGWGGECYV